MNNLCCGAGGGAWAMPYDDERLAYGKMKADQIKDTGAEIVIAPCHNCRDQIMKGLPKVHDMGNYKETLYLWELVSLCLDFEPWSEAEIERPTPPATPSLSATGSNWTKRNKPAA